MITLSEGKMLETIGYIVLGAFLVLVPGFLFSAILYPKPDSVDAWTRVGMSFGFGTMLLLYVSYFLAKPGLRLLDAFPLVTSVIGLCAALAVIAHIRGGLGLIRFYAKKLISSIEIKREKKTEGPSAPAGGQSATGAEPQPASG